MTTVYSAQCVLSSNKVGHSVGHTVSRQVKGTKQPDKIPGPRVQVDYVENVNAVDRNDQDSANYSRTICTNCYNIRIFCWVLDRDIHAVYVTVCNLSKAEMGPMQWKAYKSKKMAVMFSRLILQLI
jgi:hypothetical protein